MRNLLAVLSVFWASVCLADPPVPSISLAWKSIHIGDIQNVETKDLDFHKEGAVHITLKNMNLTSRVTGMQIAEGAIWIQGVSAQLGYDWISAKNVAILEVPKFLGGGRKTVETHIDTIRNPGISASKVGDQPWRIALPDEVELDYLRAADGATSLAFKDPGAVVAGLHKSIDEGFSDAFLDRSVRLDPRNIPGIITFLIKEKKPHLFASVRAALREEVAKPEFLRGIEITMSQQLPVLPIEKGGKLSGAWQLKANADGQMTIHFGSRSSQALLAKKDVSEKFIFGANASGVDLIIGLLFDTLARFDESKLGVGFVLKDGLMSYTPQNGPEREQLAMVASELTGTTIDPKDMASLSIDIGGKFLKREVRFVEGKDHPVLQLRFGMVVSAKDSVTVPVVWDFSTGPPGNLILDRIHVERKDEDLDSSFALFKKFEGTLKGNLACFLLNQRLAEFQRANANAKAKLSIEKLEGSEFGLRLSLQN